MDNLTTDARMRSHIIITLIVLWAISEHYGGGFTLATLTLGMVNVYTVIPNWALFLVLGIGLVQLHNHRAAVLGPIREWMGWVLVGESEE